MDPYNLAICFGPTLMPVPDIQEQVSCQAHVNEIIKTIIIHHETIFPDAKELDGPIYEKCMAGDDYWWVKGIVFQSCSKITLAQLYMNDSQLP